MAVEINVYRSLENQATHNALYEGVWGIAPVVGDVIAWDDPSFPESSKPKLWRVLARELHYSAEAEGQYIDVFVERVK